MAREDGTLQLYDVSIGDKPVGDLPRYLDNHDTYEKSREITRFPDTLPCGHRLCHKCVRRYVISFSRQAWCCPVCDRELFHNNNDGESPLLADGGEDDGYVALLSNFDEIVKEFNGVNFSLSRVKTEEVQSRKVGLTYNSFPCDLCREDHGTLNVIQEFNRLDIEHNRPSVYDLLHSRYSRFKNSNVVTSFYSKVNSSCVCVPCTFLDIQDNPESYYALTDGSSSSEHCDSKDADKLAVAEVGKLLTRRVTPVKALQGKNMIEIEHNIRIRERADHFDFNCVTEQIKKMVQQQENNLVKIVRRRIEDTGRLYHVQESNSVDYGKGETVV